MHDAAELCLFHGLRLFSDIAPGNESLADKNTLCMNMTAYFMEYYFVSGGLPLI